MALRRRTRRIRLGVMITIAGMTITAAASVGSIAVAAYGEPQWVTTAQTWLGAQLTVALR
jgi:hypothetical protein